MSMKKIELDENRILYAYCSVKSNHYGFRHSVMIIPYINGIQYDEVNASIQYINRTLERFTFETVIQAAIDKYQDMIYKNTKRRFKTENGLKAIQSKKHKANFEKELENNRLYSFLEDTAKYVHEHIL